MASSAERTLKKDFIVKSRLIVCVLAVFLAVGLAFAQDKGVEVLSRKEGIFLNKECKKTKTCDLKKVEYLVEDYKVAIGSGYNYGTRFFARFRTKSVKNLEKYVFVQFFKGCRFSSQISDGKVIVSYDVSYYRDDQRYLLFKFADWVLDSGDDDPVYSSGIPGKSRIAGYRWNTIPNSFSSATEKLYDNEKPLIPEVYIVDHPQSAFYSGDRAHNTSLQFKTCIYKTKDVPISAAYDNTDFAKPIHCYEWNSSFVYNHLTGEFESFPDIVPACKQ